MNFIEKKLVILTSTNNGILFWLRPVLEYALVLRPLTLLYQKYRDTVILPYRRYQTQFGYGDFYKDLPCQYSIINFDGLFLIAIIRLKDQVSKIDSYYYSCCALFGAEGICHSY